jgi:hypothetical protein
VTDNPSSVSRYRTPTRIEIQVFVRLATSSADLAPLSCFGWRTHLPAADASSPRRHICAASHDTRDRGRTEQPVFQQNRYAWRLGYACRLSLARRALSWCSQYATCMFRRTRTRGKQKAVRRRGLVRAWVRRTLPKYYHEFLQYTCAVTLTNSIYRVAHAASILTSMECTHM